MDRKSQREWIVKIIFQMSFNESKLEDLETILRNHELMDEEFIKDSVYSTFSNLDRIDQIIKKYITKLPFNKISNMDKAILRTSINEFVIQKTVPTSVSINEAVDIAKKYSKEDSFKFVNGILSSVAKEFKWANQ